MTLHTDTSIVTLMSLHSTKSVPKLPNPCFRTHVPQLLSFCPDQCSSVTQSCLTLCDPRDCSILGICVHHQLLDFTQSNAHWVGDVFQQSHPLLAPSSPAFNLSQDQGLSQWVSSSHQMVKVLEFQLQHQSFQWILRTDCLWDGLVGSPCSPKDSQQFPAPQFKRINSLAFNFLCSPNITSIYDYRKNHSFD